jgi:hypothetical protein
MAESSVTAEAAPAVSHRARPPWVRRARLKSISREVSSIEHALRVIGNKGTEQELLGVLEDLTVFKAENEG